MGPISEAGRKAYALARSSQDFGENGAGKATFPEKLGKAYLSEGL